MSFAFGGMSRHRPEAVCPKHPKQCVRNTRGSVSEALDTVCPKHPRQCVRGTRYSVSEAPEAVGQCLLNFPQLIYKKQM